MSDREFAEGEWERLRELSNRLQSRIWLMEEALNGIIASDPGGELKISMTALEGVSYMVEDMKKEIDEAQFILDF